MKMPIVALLLLLLSGCEPRAEVKKIKIGDSELAYTVRGRGEPLVMIMGFRGTMAVWDPALLKLLEKKYTLILFDNRGVGLSPDLSPGPLTIDQMAEDTAALIRGLGYEKAHVLGWSMGARIAMELALHHPELVDGLILCSPNPGGDYQARRKTHAYQMLSANELTYKAALELIFPNDSAAADAYAGRLSEAILTGASPKDMQVNARAVARQVEALKTWEEDNRIYANLQKIKARTLAAGGLSDVLDAPENVQTVACRIPFAWSAYFPGAGHAFLFQEHKKFADLVILFLETKAQIK